MAYSSTQRSVHCPTPIREASSSVDGNEHRDLLLDSIQRVKYFDVHSCKRDDHTPPQKSSDQRWRWGKKSMRATGRA